MIGKAAYPIGPLVGLALRSRRRHEGSRQLE